MIFDRFTTEYRDPVGAVEQGTSITFALRVPRALGVESAMLLIEYDGEDCRYIPLMWLSMDGTSDRYAAAFTAEKVGLYFYTFLLSNAERTLRLSENGRGEVLRGENEYHIPFQLTVYEQDFATPDSLTHGVMYQIFPDRFCRGEVIVDTCDRRMHVSWEEEPEYDNDPYKITNSDFFGGNLCGIMQKLPYLHELGVTVIYLNPIFLSASNHRYDTADYNRIDTLLGDEHDFTALCHAAKKLGIAIVLDGVFSHTGSESVYFQSAIANISSPYFPWYDFSRYPDKYTCWWDVPTLPCTNETEPSFLDFITGEDGIARKYIRLGASGWRLDVADELPDGFLDAFRAAVKSENTAAAVIGEVWEDASNKIAYSQRRRYLLGNQLDSVMNYPLRTAILDFVRGGNADGLADTLMCQRDHYPPQVRRCLMNILSTHDTPRTSTYLMGYDCAGCDRDTQHLSIIPEHERNHAAALVLLAYTLLYIAPGIPCVYYGDEVGMQGCSDPFNRAPFPWGRENTEIMSHFVRLSKLRQCFAENDELHIVTATDGIIVVERGRVTVCANGTDSSRSITVFGSIMDISPKSAQVFVDGAPFEV